MGGGDGLRHRGHTHGVRPQQAGGLDLRRRLVLGTGEEHVDALLEVQALGLGGGAGLFLKGGGVDAAHVREAGAQLVHVGPAEGADAEELDVVRNQHNVPGGPGGIHRPGGVGHHQSPDAQGPGHPDGIGRVGEGPALVGVEAALHDRRVTARQLSKEKLALVAGGGGALHVGDFRIGHGDGAFHLVRQGPQAGAQNHQHLGLEAVQLFPESLSALLNLLIRVEFHIHPPVSSAFRRRRGRIGLPPARPRRSWGRQGLPVSAPGFR